MSKIYAAPNYAMGSDYIVMPGARLDVGPGGKLYETLGDDAVKTRANNQAALASRNPDQVSAARSELARMRSSLRGWLKYRRFNDQIAAGTRKARIPASMAAKNLSRDRDWSGEQKLADDLYLLLSMVRSPASLPSPDVKEDPQAAVKLAQIALRRDALERSGPQATGILPLLVLTVGGIVLFTLTSFISNRAEVEKEKERIKCIRDGGCTDYGFWIKAAAVTVVGYFVWEKAGVGERVKSLMKR